MENYAYPMLTLLDFGLKLAKPIFARWTFTYGHCSELRVRCIIDRLLKQSLSDAICLKNRLKMYCIEYGPE